MIPNRRAELSERCTAAHEVRANVVILWRLRKASSESVNASTQTPCKLLTVSSWRSRSASMDLQSSEIMYERCIRQFQCSRKSFTEAQDNSSLRRSQACRSNSSTSCRRSWTRATSRWKLLAGVRLLTISRAIAQSRSMHSEYGNLSGPGERDSHWVRAEVGVARSYDMDSKLSCHMMRDLLAR